MVAIALLAGCAEVPMVPVSPTGTSSVTRRVLLKSAVGSFDLVQDCVVPLRLLSGRYTIEEPPQPRGGVVAPVMVSVDGSAPEPLSPDSPLTLTMPPGVVARVEMTFDEEATKRAHCELRAEPLKMILRVAGRDLAPGQPVPPGACLLAVSNGAGCKRLHLAVGGRSTDTRQLSVSVPVEAPEFSAEALCDEVKTTVTWPVARPAPSEEPRIVTATPPRPPRGHNSGGKPEHPERVDAENGGVPAKAPRESPIASKALPVPAPPPATVLAPPPPPIVVSLNDITQVGRVYRMAVDWELSCLKECYVRIDDEEKIIGAGYSEQKVIVRANQRVEIKEVR